MPIRTGRGEFKGGPSDNRDVIFHDQMPNESPIHSDEDVRLMLKAKEGDRQAYGRLYEKYLPIVRRFLANHHGSSQSEDLTQEVFTRVWQHRSGYRAETAICPYLLGFATNVAREYQARIRRSSAAGHTEACPPADTTDGDPEAMAHRRDMAEWVRSHLADLPAKQRQSLELVYLAQKPVTEAAALVGCSPECLRKHLSLARRKLALLLDR